MAADTVPGSEKERVQIDTDSPSSYILNSMVNYEDPVEGVFSALANPTRRSILERLRGGSRSISALAEPYDMSLVAVSKHVHRLEEAGLVRIRREGRSRVCELDAGPLCVGRRWIDRFRHFWSDELDQIDRYLDANDETGD